MSELERHTCPICGVEYAAPARFFEWRKNLPSSRKDRGWYCPNGHSLVHTNSEADRQRRRAERAEQRLAESADEIRSLENQNRAVKGHVTRLKKRAAAGTCPCCKRTFQNVATHVKRQHPEFLERQGTKVVPMKPKKSA